MIPWKATRRQSHGKPKQRAAYKDLILVLAQGKHSVSLSIHDGDEGYTSQHKNQEEAEAYIEFYILRKQHGQQPSKLDGDASGVRVPGKTSRRVHNVRKLPVVS